MAIGTRSAKLLATVLAVLSCAAILAVSPLALAQRPILAAYQPQFRGCSFFQDANFAGGRFDRPHGTQLSYVGDGWNDQISSLFCTTYCAATVYEHADYGGAQISFTGNVDYVGDGWNDQISALTVTCQY